MERGIPAKHEQKGRKRGAYTASQLNERRKEWHETKRSEEGKYDAARKKELLL